MIWATVSSWSCFCWRYKASPSLAAKHIINLISVLTIWRCPCVEPSLVLWEEGVCHDQCLTAWPAAPPPQAMVAGPCPPRSSPAQTFLALPRRASMAVILTDPWGDHHQVPAGWGKRRSSGSLSASLLASVHQRVRKVLNREMVISVALGQVLSLLFVGLARPASTCQKSSMPVHQSSRVSSITTFSSWSIPPL